MLLTPTVPVRDPDRQWNTDMGYSSGWDDLRWVVRVGLDGVFSCCVVGVVWCGVVCDIHVSWKRRPD